MDDKLSPDVVLVLDDEFLIAIELESILGAAGYRVLAAVNVAEARDLIALHRIDMAVLDFRLGAGAAEFARDLQASGTPLLFCTGSLAEEVNAVFPAVPVLPKPFSGDALIAAVADVLGR